MGDASVRYSLAALLRSAGAISRRVGMRLALAEVVPRSTQGMEVVTTVHHFTVDVEEYFQVTAFESRVSRDHWDGHESRVNEGTDALLELLGGAGVRATFFVLGWLAERNPDVVRRIAGEGHEVASHGWDHQRVTEQTPETFRSSVARSRALLEDLTGAPVVGYRAPSFSILPGMEWALDVLLEEGYLYDSSLFPVIRRGYGYRNGHRDPHWISRAGGQLLEVPPTTLRRFGLNLPAAGGAYFRMFPYGLVRAGLRDCERRGVSGTFYIHPWELDPGQPRLDVSLLTRIRHYGGLEKTAPRLATLLREFRFCAVADSLRAYHHV